MSAASKKLHLLLISNNSEERKRIQDLCREFEYNPAYCPHVDKLFDMAEEQEQIPFVVLCASEAARKEDVSGMVQVVRQIHKDAFIATVVGKKMQPEESAFIKKSGSNLVLVENELFETSKLEFIALQIIRASYIPIKVNELKQDLTYDFSVYVLMPLNQKMVPVLSKGSLLTEGKYKKMEAIGEVFVRREEISKFKKYVETNIDRSAAGLKSRCRVQYLDLCVSHTDLVFMLTDQSELASYDLGKNLFERCQKLASDLLMTLATVGEAWDIVNHSSLGDFGSLERAPTVASYAGLMSLMANIGDSTEVMIASLIADIGLLELPPIITNKIRKDKGVMNLREEELLQYKQHPTISLNRCLSRKLQMTETLKETVICTHERVDRLGFPHQPKADRIPMEAQLIQFCELIDNESMVKMGDAVKKPELVKKDIYKREYDSGQKFSILFLEKIKTVV